MTARRAAPARTPARRIAVVGAGWAGIAAAVRATEAGYRVTLFEAARTPGGRARALDLPDGTRADNGQHILIGAYARTLALMRTVGVDPGTALLRLPLDLREIGGQGIALPDLPPPFDALAGIARARGWSVRDKAALLARAARWRLSGFRCAPTATVADVCAGLPPRVLGGLVEPLCVSALNLPAAQASGTVFLRVLQDSLFAGRGGSNLLLPRADLGALLPDAALAWLAARGAAVRLGERVAAIEPGLRVAAEAFDAVCIATPAPEAARLAAPHHAAWAAQAAALAHTAIATVYAQAAHGLPRPMVALAGGPAQFVFDRGRLGGPRGLLAFVASDAHGERDALQEAVVRQAREQLGLPVEPIQTVVEKRATFACTPALQRPAAPIAPGLFAVGDYVEGPYPATLEGAVRSGEAAVSALARTAP